MKIILGTSSPWRRHLYRTNFKEFYVNDEESFDVPDIDEKAIRDSDPESLCQKIAVAKCDHLLNIRSYPEDTIVITLDQVVSCQGQIREKPLSEREARTFLKSYQEGAEATCVNGIVVHNLGNGKRETAVEKSAVLFGPFPDRSIDEVIASGQAYTTAGAFSIDHPAMSKYVQTIKGSVDSIEGLPCQKIREMLSAVTDNAFDQKPFGHVTHVLFDMDGLLLDTEDLYTKVQQRLLEPFGIKFTWEVKAMMMGRKSLDAAEVMIAHYGIGDRLKPEDFVRDREKLLDEMFPDSELMPGVERLLKHLHSHGVPMAVATSSHRRHFDLKTSKHTALFNTVFTHIVTGDDVTKSKPNPEIFSFAASKFKNSAKPELVLVFEDAPLGVEAAKAAGMKAVFVPDPNLKIEEDLSDQRLNTLLHFKPEQWGLPPFQS